MRILAPQPKARDSQPTVDSPAVFGPARADRSVQVHSGGPLVRTAGIPALPRTRRRRQTVFFRRIIPHDLRQRFGQREILRSLGRATPGEARRMAQRSWDGTDQLSRTELLRRPFNQAAMIDRSAPSADKGIP
ncbi:DUF6538 domain-containing protein [Methylobacterium sp. AMS5]|uniref:DUF6538 domain-containing protein n=1 Tax=Methylobacteriaceae TaxID=119045 RepID=UPI003369C646